MIGAIAAAGMQGIVTDGLVLHLDAGNSNSYSGVGTTWYDLSGKGNNAFLAGGVNYDSKGGGSLIFGENKYAELANVLQLGTNPFTASIWFYIISNSPYNPLISFGGSNTDGGELEYGLMGGSLGYYALGIRIREMSNVVLNQWIMGTLVHRKNADNVRIISLYLNGILVAGDYTTSFNFNNFGSIVIGSNHSARTEVTKGNISNVQIHLKALTQSEITQNFNADRARYGL